VVCAWIGNSERVAQNHYLQVTGAHIALATAEPAKADEPSVGAAQNPAQCPAVTSLPERKAAEVTERKTLDLPENNARHRMRD
jgi:hypothetical protein